MNKHLFWAAITLIVLLGCDNRETRRIKEENLRLQQENLQLMNMKLNAEYSDYLEKKAEQKLEREKEELSNFAYLVESRLHCSAGLTIKRRNSGELYVETKCECDKFFEEIDGKKCDSCGHERYKHKFRKHYSSF